MFRAFRHEKCQYYVTFERVRNCGTFFADIPCVYRKNFFFGRVLHMEFRKKVFSIRKTQFLFRMFRAH